MTEIIKNIFVSIFGDNGILATILIAMVPIIELRGAIPFATLTYSMNRWEAFAWSLLGSCAIVPIIALISMPLINWLKRTKLFGKLAMAFENRIKNKASSINGANETGEKFSKSYWKKMLGIFIFVAIPLPLTGVWTGTCVSLFIGLGFFSTCISVILGNVFAGLFITLILQAFPWLDDWLFLIFLAIIAVVVIYELIKFLINKKHSANGKQPETDAVNNTTHEDKLK